MRSPLFILLSLVLSFALRAAEPVQTAARLLPPETFLFAEVHDAPRTVERLGLSSWGDLAREPEVRDFFRKLIDAVAHEVPVEARAILDEIVRVEPSGAFFALVEMPDMMAVPRFIPKMLIGVTYRGEPARAEALLQKRRDGLHGEALGKHSKETVGNIEVETFADSKFPLFVAHADKQVLFATDRQTLLDALARRAGNGSRSLADAEPWKAAEKEHLAAPDGTAYFSYDEFLRKIFAAGGPNAAALSTMKDLMPRSFTVSTKMDGHLMHERAFLDSRIVLPRAESRARNRSTARSPSRARTLSPTSSRTSRSPPCTSKRWPAEMPS